jgi:hypothetical protein
MAKAAAAVFMLAMLAFAFAGVRMVWQIRSGKGPPEEQPVRPGFCDRPGNQCDEPGEFAAEACRPGAAARCAGWVREEARDAEDATWAAWHTHPRASVKNTTRDI